MSPLSPAAFYILVATDADPFQRSLPSAYQIALHCLDESAWGLSESTRKGGLTIGSSALIYIAGRREHAQSFIAVAEIAGRPFRERMAFGEKIWPRRLPLGGIRKFQVPVSIRPLVKKLGFATAAKPRWGGRLQNTVVEISERAFRCVLAASLEPAISAEWVRKNLGLSQF